MKKIIFLISITSILLFSCYTKMDVNKVIVDPDLKKEILIGSINEKGLDNAEVFTNTEMYYRIYDVNTEIAKEIKEKSKNISIKVVFGSWCGDSKINVPAFRKIVDESGFDKSKVEYIAVDKKKRGGSVDVSGLKTNYVPTFIFYRDNKEIGRIIEYPSSETIEQDWLNIVTEE